MLINEITGELYVLDERKFCVSLDKLKEATTNREWVIGRTQIQGDYLKNTKQV